jgi:ATP-dependent RNA helicase RhlE
LRPNWNRENSGVCDSDLTTTERQTLFFSATMPPEVAKLAETILVNPINVAVDPVSSTVDLIEQAVYFVAKEDKRSLLIHLLRNNKSIISALVFTRTKYGANKVARGLIKAGIYAEAIHGDKSQTQPAKIARNAFTKSGSN